MGVTQAGVLMAGLLLPAPATADSAVIPLARGDARTSVLAPNEAHAYVAELRAGHFLHVLVEQEEVDVVVTADDPAGRRRIEVDNPYGRDVPESIALIAAVDGTYRLEIRPSGSATKAGSYRLVVAAWRPATPADRLWAAAEDATNAAHQRADRRTADDLRAAAEGYHAARELWRQLGDRRQEARALGRLGQLRRRLGEDQAAFAALEEALALERELQNPAGVASILNEIGRVHRRRGENDQALAIYREALAIRQELGDASHEARLRNNMGAALHAMGELLQALEQYEQALEAFRRLGDRFREAIALINLGHLRSQLGRIDRALADFERALILCEALGRRDLEGDLLNNLAVTLDELGEIHTALESYSAALEVYRELGDARRQAATLNSQGGLLVELGLPEEARQVLLAAAELLREHADPYLESRVQSSLGAAARDVGDFAAALDLFARSLDLQRRAGDRAGEARSLHHQAVIHHRTGDAARAGELARQALAVFREIGEARGESLALRTLGQSAAALGETEAARRAFESAARRAEEIDDVDLQARSLQELGRLERDAGRLRVALTHLEGALAHFESLRARISGQTLRASHFAAVREAYELAVDTAARLHREHPEAGFDRRGFALSERALARGLLDVVGRARADVAADPELRARERQLRRELNALALQRRRSAPDEALDARIAALTTEYRLLEGRLSPPSESPAGDSALSPSFVDEVAALLDGDTVLLEITLGEPRSYLWVVARGTLESFELPGRAKIEAAAERLHRHLGRPASDRAERQAALDELSRMVLGPAFDRLASRRWVIVPDGALHYVPFAALPVPSGPDAAEMLVPLVVEHEVVHLPSAAVLAQLRRAKRPPAAGRLAILADPVYGDDDPRHRQAAAGERVAGEDAHGKGALDSLRDAGASELVRLPWSGQEARAIVAETGGDGVLLALGFDASRELATGADLGRYRVVHFATHGVLDTQHPELSGLAFSRYDAAGRRRESFLRLHDVYPLRWQTELVVLSGCQTALGRTVRGEGLIGLARGFLHAGAAQVVASLWSVRDQATAELMRRFYRGLFRDRLTPAAALRAAQLSMWRERRWRDPYFWAPFVLIGDWQNVAEPAGEPDFRVLPEK